MHCSSCDVSLSPTRGECDSLHWNVGPNIGGYRCRLWQLWRGRTSLCAVSRCETVSLVQIRYRIEDTLGGRFRVDEAAGVILTRGSFDNLDGQTLTLMVTHSISQCNLL